MAQGKTGCSTSHGIWPGSASLCLSDSPTHKHPAPTACMSAPSSASTGQKIWACSGAAVVGGGAIAVQAGAPYVAAASGGLIAGTKGAWRNLSFDGPSPGGLHANGRLLGVRWKGGQWGVRLDLHPINSGSTPILHINFGPLARGEAAHLILFDPRWIKKGGE